MLTCTKLYQWYTKQSWRGNAKDLGSGREQLFSRPNFVFITNTTIPHAQLYLTAMRFTLGSDPFSLFPHSLTLTD